MDIQCRIGNETTEIITAPLIEALKIADDKTLIVSDEHVAPLIPTACEHLCILHSGEEHKNFESIQRILSYALDAGLGRDCRFIGIGGGVICDMTAFAASIYMRGVPVSLIPTTLLSMVDASIGGKTGVDFQQVKNIAGTFYPARQVYICTEMLHSLSDREFRSGLAEIIKHAYLAGGELLEMIREDRQSILDRDDDAILEKLIIESLMVKKAYIEEDPQERSGIRARLNLGHSFGHALETIHDLSSWSHGEAVAWGMLRAAEAGELSNLCTADYVRGLREVLKAYGFDVDYRIPEDMLEAYVKAISSDKKKKDGEVRFVIQQGVGSTILTTLDMRIVEQVISSSRRV